MNPFLEFRPEDDASNYAAGQAAKVKKAKLEARRQAAMELVSKSLASAPDRMIGGGSNGSFGERPGILVPGNTVASALAGVAGAAVGQYGVSQADEETATQAEARDKAFRDAVGEAVGGASSNVTGIPPQRDDTAMQASPNAVRANLERGMDPQLANATGVPANALQPAGMPSSGNPPPPPAQSAGNGDMSIRQLLQLAHDFPEDSKAINTLLQAKSWEGRDAAKTDNQFELAKMKLDSAAQQMAQRVTNAQEMAALKQQYALELQQLRQQFTSQQNAQYRRTADQQNAPKVASGGVNPATGQPMSKPIKTTESERAAAGYSGRMEQAGVNIDALPNKEAPTLAETIRDAIPIAGDPLQRKFGSDNRNQQRAQQVDWYRAKLRSESGAVIGVDEAYEESKAYFPAYGDSKQIIADKAKLRTTAEQAMRVKAGNAAPGKPAANIDTPTPTPTPKRYTAKDGSVWELRNGQPVKVSK